MTLVLSLFPGIDLLGRAFEEEGFCVVRGPDLFWGGDIHSFHPPADRFDGVIGGPPCQAHSSLAHLVRHNGYQVAPDLIPEFERCVAEAGPTWWLMENVPKAPIPEIEGYETQSLFVDNRWYGGEQQRRRRFTWGARSDVRIHLEPVVFVPQDWYPCVTSGSAGRRPVAVGGSGKRKRPLAIPDLRSREGFREACRLQGLPDDFELPSMTVSGAIRLVGNGVAMPTGRAFAKAVREALRGEQHELPRSRPRPSRQKLPPGQLRVPTGDHHESLGTEPENLY